MAENMVNAGGNMTKKQALRASITHWEKDIVGRLEKNESIVELVGRFGCSLCMKFIEENCKDCPVRYYSGEASCRQTPYVKFDKMYEDFSYELKQLIKPAGLEFDFLLNIWYAEGHEDIY